ncbi:helix-turn-helix domain-containing protein [Hyphomicrobium sp. LHD-15]|uniref:helix-turn-helix domain-containing protein n=1 Tax=Hyphomicrobium sp. LHD-15 TaxID=3072142 RepID=UPI00280E2872|nr:helix-turn-helix domain-containing protein [Hyphomicrobium sp. LHD-15]MDQ8700584.1 helix-turn-helix domain-containing protein [Hyphomicrobium sp. LHD-15]
MQHGSNVATAGGAKPLKLDPETYYPEPEAAELFGVSVDTMRRKRMRAGISALPFSRFGRKVFYRGADLITALDASRQISPPKIGERA